MTKEVPDMLHQATTWIANTITLTAILGWLPHVATILAIMWYACLFIEKFTGRKMSTWFKKKKNE